MLKKIMMLATVVLAVISVGCASVPMASMEEDKIRKEFKNPPDDKAAVYIYRSSSFGSAIKKEVKIDGESIGKTAIKTYFYKVVDPGEHVISTQSEFGENEITIDMMAGKNYFVNQYIKPGVVVGGSNVKLVDEEKGKKAVLKCKLAK